VRISILAAATALAAVVGAAPAMAKSVQNEFLQFSHCPVSNPGIDGCTVSTTTGGEFVMGSTAVTINKDLVLQGGLPKEGNTLVPPNDGTPEVSKTPLTVPGGLVGIEGVGPEITATAEPAGPIELDLANLYGAGPLVELPLTVKLDGTGLGETCFIGKPSEPVSLTLTTGTTSPPSPNKPITGSAGTRGIEGEGYINHVTGTVLVDNSFSVPGVNGCGGSLLELVLDPAVDLKAGLPAAAGKNTAVMQGEFIEVDSRLVKTEVLLPEFGTCTKIAPVKNGKITEYLGQYQNPGCYTEAVENDEPNRVGKYEWSPAPGAKPGFSGTLGKFTLETLGKNEISCLEGSDSGEYNGLKTEKLGLTLTGCENKALGTSCHSTGASAGEITSSLSGTLGFIKDSVEEKPTTGLLLKPQSGSVLATIVCGSTEEIVEGSLIGTITPPDASSLNYTLALKGVLGKQTPQSFEEGPTQTLTTTIVSGSSRTTEGSAINGTAHQRTEAPTTLKARAF
jgi:hypothetical protein